MRRYFLLFTVLLSLAGSAEPSKTIAILLVPSFETLDVYGPVQMLGRLPDHKVVCVAQKAGAVRSAQGVEAVASYSFEDAPQFNVLLVPGGMGTRKEIENEALLGFLRRQDRGTDLTTSVCTGAALLARAGILDGRRATTNKRAFRWVAGVSDKVQWIGRARWVSDGKYVTSSGISAGMDLALALVERLYDRGLAEKVARGAEYQWNDDAENDPFAIEP
jgi:transcriptional regulator GlxA family with amidase domain